MKINVHLYVFCLLVLASPRNKLHGPSDMDCTQSRPWLALTGRVARFARPEPLFSRPGLGENSDINTA